MQDFYLLQWLNENSGLDPELVDSLKFNLDKRIYHYGDHYVNATEKSKAESVYRGLRSAAKKTLNRFRAVSAPGTAEGGGIKISSHAYFSFNGALAERGFSVTPVPWLMSREELGNARLYRLITDIHSMLENADFKDLLTAEFAGNVAALKSELKDYYLHSGVSALVVPFDLPFFERIAIRIFKELKRPSFISLHGLPGRYNDIDDNRTDYLLVWGEKIKEFYVRAGIPAGKIFVTGHPSYRSPVVKKLRYSFEDVLVMGKSMNGAQHSAEKILSDRGNLPLYLYSLRKVLLKAGIKSARLRLHPSESRAWYSRFIDTGFFIFDKETLTDSLNKATLVIGPTSTVFVESLVAGVNYLIYEPAINGRDMGNYPLVPPFDGAERGIPAAHSEDELAALLSTRTEISADTLSGYIKNPFDLSFLSDLIPQDK